jgi:hypothetical protein
MGDRFVVGFANKQSDTPIIFYSHWGGFERYVAVANAIQEARLRWNDHAYATRIAISQLVGSDWNQELGYGITTDKSYIGAADYEDYPVVVWDERKVLIHTPEWITELDFETFTRLAREGTSSQELVDALDPTLPF